MICTECAQDVPAATKLSFLGFPTFMCPSCNKQVRYPLSMGRKIFYWLLVALFAGITINALAHGAVAMPGLLGILVIIAVVTDLGQMAKVREAERRHQAMQASLAAAAEAAKRQQPPST
jgi:hypothetical protein